MIEIYSYWIEEFGVDGFRIDTTKHVNMEFWQAFGPAILDAAEDRGIEESSRSARCSTSSSVRPSSVSSRRWASCRRPSTSRSRWRPAGSPARPRRPRSWRRSSPETTGTPTPTATPMRCRPSWATTTWAASACSCTDNPGAADAELVSRSVLAHALMFFVRGQPVVYYGDEQGFTGSGGDKLARQDMFANEVAEYEDDDLIGTDHTSRRQLQPRPSAVPRHPGPVRPRPGPSRAQGGAQIHRYSSTGPGIYAFSRIDRPARGVRRCPEQRRDHGLRRGTDLLPGRGEVPTRVAHLGAERSSAVADHRGRRGAQPHRSPARLRRLPGQAHRAGQLGRADRRHQHAQSWADRHPRHQDDGRPRGHRPHRGGGSTRHHPMAEVTFAVREGDGTTSRSAPTTTPVPRLLRRQPLRGHEDTPLSFRAIVNDLSGHVASD